MTKNGIPDLGLILKTQTQNYFIQRYRYFYSGAALIAFLYWHVTLMTNLKTLQMLYTTDKNVETKVNINFNLIAIWNDQRKDEDTVKDVLDRASNRFSFARISSSNEDLHIYMGYDLNSNSVKLTIIEKQNDTISNTSCIGEYPLSNGAKCKLPDFIQTGPPNPNDIPWEEANERINNWSSTTKREAWVHQRFSDYDTSEAIFQAFVVSGNDVEFGAVHDCYLALRYSEVDMTYKADLIIVNTNTGAILNRSVQEFSTVEDLVYPIPPFESPWPKKDFGVLLRLNE